MASRRRSEDLEIAAAFGRQLKQLRQEQGLTQEALAEAAEMHPTFISNVERGYRVPTLPTVLRLARGLSVSPTYLIEGLAWADEI